MHRMLFVNLPVADIDRSRKYFTDLGYTFNEDFCDERALSMVLGENLFAMLLRNDYYAEFHTKETVDAKVGSECLICVTADSREEVDALVDKAVAAGGTAGRVQEHGDFMYGRAYDDLDGHTWEVMWMNPVAAEVGPEEFLAQNA